MWLKKSPLRVITPLPLEGSGVRLQSTNRRRLSSFAEKATSKGGEISDGVLWDREVEIEL